MCRPAAEGRREDYHDLLVEVHLPCLGFGLYYQVEDCSEELQVRRPVEVAESRREDYHVHLVEVHLPCLGFGLDYLDLHRRGHLYLLLLVA